jgi:outer membrane protein OmpA-like peptidoglycan-associated protein/tetratricopeptide (TPR) repeat protein
MKYIFFALIIFFSGAGFAQDACPQTQNKKAAGYMKEAQSLFQAKRDYEKARSLVQRAIDEDPEYADAYLLSGFLAQKKRDYKTMGEMLRKAIELCEAADPEAYYQLGWLAYDMKKYKEAEKYLGRFLEFDKINEEHGIKAEGLLVKAKLYANPVPFDPRPVPGISTADPEYLAIISPDNEYVFFTRRFDQSQKGLITSTSVEKFMQAKRTNGVFDKGIPMDYPFNQKAIGNEGGATITIDNKHLFFTVNRDNNFDIYYSDWNATYWDDITNMGPAVNDPKQWDSQPSVTADGNTLYFASARDSLTGIDIYKTHRDAQGKWTQARKLPPPVNTNGNDKSPFIHQDGRTLYFSSDSLPGLGGYDIFMSRMDAKGTWSEPVNLGYPINTEADEVGFFASTDGRYGYFASNSIKGSTGFDVFSFELYPKMRPQKVTLQTGELKTDGPDSLVSATIELKNTFTNELTRITVDSVTGQYAFVATLDHDVVMTIKKKGYAFESEYISANDSSNIGPVKKNILLEKIDVGKSYTINDILFATNSYQVNDTIKAVVNEFSDYLSQNPKLTVTIEGHTDNVGNPTDNLILSQNRARSIYDYLVERGIDKSRLSYKGYGETKPIATNSTSEGKAKNRRTVFKVIAK